jgi:thymidylate synthase ThyX
MTSATIIKDSTSYLGTRITTLILEYPRLIHGEFLTHRAFSKNAAGSRAIPVEKIIQGVKENTVYPIWTLNQKGMQGDLIKNEGFIDVLNEYVKNMRDESIGYVQTLSSLGVHKQNANRYLEPFQHIKLICTGTDWNNFFTLRCHESAQPEIQSLAENIRQAMKDSKPNYLQPGQWHIPFEDFLLDGTSLSEKIKVSVARCARISYNNFETNSIDVKKDVELYERLVVQEPAHMSPAEHQARVPTEQELEHFSCRYLTHEVGKFGYHKGKYISNLSGWIQLRKVIENGEHINN